MTALSEGTLNQPCQPGALGPFNVTVTVCGYDTLPSDTVMLTTVCSAPVPSFHRGW